MNLFLQDKEISTNKYITINGYKEKSFHEPCQVLIESTCMK